MSRPRPSATHLGLWGLWLVALAAVLGFFFELELPALANALPGDTLSEAAWWVQGLHPYLRAALAGVVGLLGAILIALGVWIPVHIIGGGRWDRGFTDWLKRRLGGSLDDEELAEADGPE